MHTASRSFLAAVAFAFAIAPLLSVHQQPDAGCVASAASVEAHEREIGALIRGLAAATNTREFEAFGSAITEDWTYFTSGGSEVNLAGFVELISGWTTLHIEVSDIRPRLSADERLAWATFRGRLRGKAEGVAAERLLRFTAILHRTNAGWRLHHLQSTVASQGR